MVTAETPVGEVPAGGGRRRKWASEAERVAAYRRRRAEETAASAPPVDEAGEPTPVPPEQAHSALARVLEQITTNVARIRQENETLAARVEAAVAGIADPDAVSSALEACTTAANERVAVAEARAADVDRRRVQAEHDAEAARAAATEAQDAADAFDERLREVEAWAEAAKDGWEAEQAARAEDARRHTEGMRELTAAHKAKVEALRDEHVEAVEALRTEHAAEVRRLQTEHAGHVEEVRDGYREQLAAEVRRTGDEVATRERAERSVEGLTSELVALRAELDGVRAAVPSLVEEAREETRRALTTLHAAELAACEARREGELAELAGRLEGCEARRMALGEQVEVYRVRLAESES